MVDHVVGVTSGQFAHEGHGNQSDRQSDAQSRVGVPATLETARLLLDASADPNDGRFWHALPTPFTVLTGVLGYDNTGCPYGSHAARGRDVVGAALRTEEAAMALSRYVLTATVTIPGGHVAMLVAGNPGRAAWPGLVARPPPAASGTSRRRSCPVFRAISQLDLYQRASMW